MVKQTTVPETALPLALSNQNALSVRYKTNLLAPAIGPHQKSNIQRALTHKAKTVLTSLSNLEKGIVIIKNDNKVLIPESSKIKEFINIPRLEVNPNFMDDFSNPLRYYSSELIESITQFRPVSPRVRTRPRQEFTSLKIEPRSGRNVVKPLQEDQVDIAENLVEILDQLSAPTFANALLFDKGILTSTGNLIDTSLLELSRADRLKTVLGRINERSQRPSGRPTARTSEYLEAIAGVAIQDAISTFKDKELVREFESQPTLIGALQATIRPIKPIDPAKDFLKEWGIQRYENLELRLGTPVLKGPIKATAVSPKSSLQVVESMSMQEEIATLTRQSRTVTDSVNDVALTSSVFQQHLENLTEHSINSATSFDSEATLRESLTETRRSAIQKVVRTISEENEHQQLSRSLRASNTSSEYTTEGKDPLHSTTEIDFQVVVPATAEVLLEDVGLVWTPTITQPFVELSKMLEQYEKDMAEEYRNQYHAPEPVVPSMTFDEPKLDYYIPDAIVKPEGLLEYDNVIIHRFEKYVSLLENENIDKNSIKLELEETLFLEQLSFKDKRVVELTGRGIRASLNHIAVEGNKVSGEVRIEWHLSHLYNPHDDYFVERLITGGIGYKVVIPICMYDPESIAAKRAYEAQLKDSAFQAQSIESRAKQYGKLKKAERLREIERTYDLRQECFRHVLSDISKGLLMTYSQTYYEHQLLSCINWDEARITFDLYNISDLPQKDVNPNHFLNALFARLFLPIYRSAEQSFFEIINGMNEDRVSEPINFSFYKTAEEIRDSVQKYRAIIKAEPFVLDTFDTEIVIGHHKEAVISNYQFATSPDTNSPIQQ